MLRTLLLVSLLSEVISSPSGFGTSQPRASDREDNVVSIFDEKNFCMIMPRSAHTNIGDSEHPGGMKAYCSSEGRHSSQQGLLPDDFWRNVAFRHGTGKNGKKYAQLTGCIRADQFSQLNADDFGGQYDSSGGSGGHGNPEGSMCLGYNHYIELVEPASPRACIRCCDDPADCPTSKGWDVNKRGTSFIW
ncbi:hypothetical protein B0H17DRAFT_1176597 [Mycena rosella]|uniref:Uncharacterized protein n=1 Tax=Mycena rosella TaxID=1033263 RepID=A0AAD7GQX7_MYCRO|nr:hypothetical protein B0H17DRAFT_1176597 [Mycena rosella]